MQIMSDSELEMLSVKELRKLRDIIDDAIRAAIRQTRAHDKTAVVAPRFIDLEHDGISP